jgi:hypothetical protein
MDTVSTSVEEQKKRRRVEDGYRDVPESVRA